MAATVTMITTIIDRRRDGRLLKMRGGGHRNPMAAARFLERRLRGRRGRDGCATNLRQLRAILFGSRPATGMDLNLEGAITTTTIAHKPWLDNPKE